MAGLVPSATRYARGMSWTNDREQARWFAGGAVAATGRPAFVYAAAAPLMAVLADIDSLPEGAGAGSTRSWSTRRASVGSGARADLGTVRSTLPVRGVSRTGRRAGWTVPNAGPPPAERPEPRRQSAQIAMPRQWPTITDACACQAWGSPEWPPGCLVTQPIGQPSAESVVSRPGAGRWVSVWSPHRPPRG